MKKNKWSRKARTGVVAIMSLASVALGGLDAHAQNVHKTEQSPASPGDQDDSEIQEYHIKKMIIRYDHANGLISDMTVVGWRNTPQGITTITMSGLKTYPSNKKQLDFQSNTNTIFINKMDFADGNAQYGPVAADIDITIKPDIQDKKPFAYDVNPASNSTTQVSANGDIVMTYPTKGIRLISENKLSENKSQIVLTDPQGNVFPNPRTQAGQLQNDANTYGLELLRNALNEDGVIITEDSSGNRTVSKLKRAYTVPTVGPTRRF